MKENKTMQTKVRQAFVHAVPPGNIDAILSRCGREKERSIVVMLQPKRNRILRTAAAIAAVFTLIAAGGVGVRAYQANYLVASTVSLDVNPSIEITVNEKERVLAVTPKNEDAIKVVGDMDFAGNSIEVTVNALIGSMLRAGYLDDIADAILVSVNSQNSEAGQALQKRLTETVEAILREAAFEGRLLTQKAEVDKTVAEKAEQNSITLGKAQLIEAVLARTADYTFEELSQWNVGALNILLEEGLSDGTAEKILSVSKDSFVSAEAAKQAAIALSELDEGLVENYTSAVVVRNERIVYQICYDDIKFRFYIHVDAQRGEAELVNREMHMYRLENLSEERLNVLDAALAHAKLQREDIIICAMSPTIRKAIGLEDFYHICFMTKDKTMYHDYQVGRYTFEIFAETSMPYHRSPYARFSGQKNGYAVSKNAITREDMEAGTLEAIRLDCGMTKEQFTITTSVSLIANLRPNTVSYMIKFTTADGEYKYICDVLKDYEIIDKTFTPAK